MNEELRKGYRKAVRTSGLVMAHVLFLVAVEQIIKVYAHTSYPLQGQENLVGIIRYIFIGLTFVDFFMIRFIKGVMDKGARKQGYTGKKLVDQFFAVNVVKDGLCSAVAYYGLILFYLGGRPSDFYAFLVTSLVLFGFFFPRLSDWEERWRAVEMMHQPSTL